MNLSTRRRASLVLVAGVATMATSLALAGGAAAAPKGIFAIYRDCPTDDPAVVLCTYAETNGGELAIGSTSVPITKPIVLQGGGVPAGGPNFNEYDLVAATDGDTMSKTALNVPGGLAGLVKCEEIKGSGLLEALARATCRAVFENGVTGVTATTELVATATNPAVLNLTDLVEESGTALSLPVRAHLQNPLLGEGCYVGSAASPLELHLTDGKTSPPPPNTPIAGKLGTPASEVEGEFESLTTTGNVLVDNAFSVPVAEGCGGALAFLIDPVIDAKLGLPSAAGHNTAILDNTLHNAEAEAVVASEGP
jgi:hypothetical protein